MRLRLWPRTLVVQLILVTTLAVVLSTIGVSLWNERDNQQRGADSLNQRMLDRTAAVATTLIAVPRQSHAVVLRAMGTPFWQFSEIPGQAPQPAMTDEESKFAQRFSASLPEDYANRNAVTVKTHVNSDTLPRSQRPPRWVGKNNETTVVFLPLDKSSYLSAAFAPQTPQAPIDLWVAAVVAILIASAGAVLVARRVARPLSALTNAASVVARGGNAPHLEEKGPDDVRNAAIAFNKMTDQVRRTLESQRHLLSAVGHDLRTPITAMRINLEFVTEDDLRERLMQNLDELQALTEQVLSSARGAGGEAKRSVDLSALLESLVADLDDMGEPVTWQNHDSAPVTCRPNEIRRAVRNLVENAVAYGHKADVQIAESTDGYDILVEDEGPGIPEDDHVRVFEPFVRLESSRNSATGGTGLGLSLVKAIAENHGGGVVLENRKGGGLRARLHLPRLATN